MEAQIAHSSRKRENARKIADQVVKDAERQRARLDKLAKDLQVVQKAADDAQGRLSALFGCPRCSVSFQRLREGLAVTAWQSQKRTLRNIDTCERFRQMTASIFVLIHHTAKHKRPCWLSPSDSLLKLFVVTSRHLLEPSSS